MTTFTRGDIVRKADNPHHKGVVVRFIDDRPVVQWTGDNDITMHDPLRDPESQRPGVLVVCIVSGTSGRGVDY